MAFYEGPGEVRYFLETLSTSMRPFLHADLQLLQKQLKTSDVGPWDVPTVDGILSKFDISEYLNIYDCFAGFSKLAHTLFGVTLAMDQPKEGEVWHKDVIKFNVSHQEHGDYG